MSVMKAKEIMEVIPHRQPMLLIDTIEELTPGEHGIGRSVSVTTNPILQVIFHRNQLCLVY